jgi:plastocyanin
MNLRSLLPLAAVLAAVTACSSTETSGAEPGNAAAPAPSATQQSTPTPIPEAGSSAPAAAAPTITIADFEYEVPGPVAAGAEVMVVNEDTEAHTFTLKGTDAEVVVQGGGTATLTAPTTPGTYEVVCDFHGSMTAELVVS